MSADISVIIPARDRLWALPKAVASCRSNRLAVQIIVIDDASTDGTAEWLKSQADMEVVAGGGWGKPAGIARALPLATGKYLRYLDSDDWLNDDANELQFDIAEREGADVVVAGFDLYNDLNFVARRDWVETDDFIAQQLGESFGSHYSAFLFRSDFVRDIPHRTLFAASEFASRDDRAFMLEVALRHPRIAVASRPTLCHRHHDKPRLQFRRRLASIGTFIQEVHIYRQILRLLGERNELSPRRIHAANNILWPLAHRLALADIDEGCDIAGWVYRLDPKFRPPEPGLLGWLYRVLGFRTTERLLEVRRAIVGTGRR